MDRILVKCTSDGVEWYFTIGHIYEIIPMFDRYVIQENRGIFLNFWSNKLKIIENPTKNQKEMIVGALNRHCKEHRLGTFSLLDDYS